MRKPTLLIMDEATAFIDHETDLSIQRTIRTSFQHATVITIAHRLRTIIDYDHILVLDNGQVVESGTPAELLGINDSKVQDENPSLGGRSGSGRFQALWQSQSQETRSMSI